jgi:hypothetical protein
MEKLEPNFPKRGSRPAFAHTSRSIPWRD